MINRSEIKNLQGPASLSPTVAVFFICLASFLFYFALALNFPGLYWVDAHIRLALRNQILIGYWPPLLQILIYTVWKFRQSLLMIRGILSLLSAAVLLCVYRFISRLFDSHAGLIAATFLAVNLMFVAMATVPYPEIIFIGLVLLALDLLDSPAWSRHFYLGALALNLACLTRYEGWLLTALFVVETALRSLKSREWKNFIGLMILYGVVPLAWLICVVSEPDGLIARIEAIMMFTTGRAVNDQFFSRLNMGYIRDFTVNYFHLLWWQAGPAILALGIVGWLIAFVFAPRRFPHLRVLIFLISDWFLIAFWGPWEFSNLRQTFVVEVFLVLYSAYGLQQLILVGFKWLHVLTQNANQLDWQNGITTTLVLLMVFSSVPVLIKFVADNSQLRDYYIPSQIGAWLNSHLGQNDAILLLSDDPFQPYALATYADRPFDEILDDRFDRQYIQARLSSASRIYVVELYAFRSGLSVGESALLNKLETRKITAQSYVVATRHVWIVSNSNILNILNVR